MMKVTIKQKIEIEQVAGTVWHRGEAKIGFFQLSFMSHSYQ